MRDMRIVEKCAARADDCFRPAAGGAWIHRHAFTNEAVLADDQANRLAALLEVLRLLSDRRKGEDARARPNPRIAGLADVRDQPRAVAHPPPPSDTPEQPHPPLPPHPPP